MKLRKSRNLPINIETFIIAQFQRLIKAEPVFETVQFVLLWVVAHILVIHYNYANMSALTWDIALGRHDAMVLKQGTTRLSHII